jgi:predicted DNA-binding transcriptional regulator AlpA
MANSILRLKATCALFGLGRTDFDQKVRHHSDDDPYIPGTSVPRLRAVPLGERSVGFFSDEINETLEALRRLRDQLTPENLAEMKRAAKADREAKEAARAAKRNERDLERNEASPLTERPRGSIVRRPRPSRSAARSAHPTARSARR